MDQLQKDVSKLLEDDTNAEVDTATTFYRIKGLALSAAAGRQTHAISLEATAPRQPPPRLTEAWFC